MSNPAEALSTRARILAKALEVFAELGFEGATTRRIADAAGENVGLIKYYFDSKELLWQEAADLAFSGMKAALGSALEELDRRPTADRIRELTRRLTLFIATNPGSVRMMQDAGRYDGRRMRWLVDRHLRPTYTVIHSSIVRLQEDGSLPQDIDPAHLFYLLVGAATLLFHQGPECRYLTGVDPRAPDVAEAHADALVRILGLAKPASDAGER